MSEIGYLPILTAALAAFAMSAIWNAAVFGDAIMKLHDPKMAACTSLETTYLEAGHQSP